MAYKDIKPGKYKAIPIAGKFGESGQKKTPGVGIQFQFEPVPGQIEVLSWTGWLSERAMERTFKTLALCGYDEAKGNLPDGTIPREYFDPKAEVEIDVQEEQYINDKGEPKTSMKIAWVNKLGGSGFAVADAGNVATMLKGIGGLKAHMAAARAELGLGKTPVTKEKPKTTTKAVKGEPVDSAPETKDVTGTGEPDGFDEKEEIPW